MASMSLNKKYDTESTLQISCNYGIYDYIALKQALTIVTHIRKSKQLAKQLVDS